MRFRALLAVFAVCLGVAAPAAAQTTGDYDRILDELADARRKVAEAERREKTLRKDIASAGARRYALERELADISSRLQSAEGRLGGAEAVAGTLQQRIRGKSEELQRSLNDLQAAHQALQRRAVRIYKSGPLSFLDFLFGSLDFGDLATRMQTLGRVFSADRRHVETVRETKERIAAERDAIEALRQRALAQLGVVRRERNGVASLRGAMEGKRKELVAELKRKHATLEDVQENKEAWLREARELEAESRRIASFLKGRTGGKATVGPGGMIWPTDGELSSPFGWRTHPIFGSKRFHAGIDIAAAAGQPVVAAADGVVIYTGPKGGYGNVVILDHGGGLATLYAHLGSIGAGNGATLIRGRSLGRVGCTGYCTGPHLHFEVRVNGEPQNPMRWLG